nr:MAG: hypothetical protein J07AB56_06950 [Candidatus Nanosalinarum sp. J07AB56]
MEEPFVIVVVIALAVLGLFVVLDSEGFPDLGQGTEAERMVFVSESFGQIGSTGTDFRTLDLGGFSVGEGRGDVTAFEREGPVSVSQGILSENELVFNYNATQPRDGAVTFEVLGRKGGGELYVDVNGQRVFERDLVSEGTPEITVPQQRLNPGTNVFVVGTTRGSLLGSSEYRLEEVRGTVNDRRFSDVEKSFTLYGYELRDFQDADLSFEVARSERGAPLQISVNDNQVYSKRQLAVPQETVNLTPVNADLVPGANTIRFDTRRPSVYTLRDAEITLRYLGNVEQGSARTQFGLAPSETDYANREDTAETISFDYQNLLPSPTPVTVELNNYTTSLTPENGRNTVEIPEGEIKEENTLEFRSRGTFQLQAVDMESVNEDG